MHSESTDKPILFSTPMVRAIDQDRKNTTRRVITKLRGFGNITEFGRSDTPGYDWRFRCKRRLWNELRHEQLIKLARYQVGDILYVQETWAPIGEMRPSGYFSDPKLIGKDYWYRAIDCLPTWGGNWKSAMFMPRLVARTFLEVTAVDASLVQDITEEQAIDEGSQCAGVPASLTNRGAFAKLWNELNAKRGVCKTCKGHGVVVAWAGSLSAGSLEQTSKDCPDCRGVDLSYSWENNPGVFSYTFKKI